MQKTNINISRNEIFAVLMVFLSGIVFLAGEMHYFVSYGMEAFFGDIQKITVQSNFLSLIVSGIYLKNPNSNIFKNNVLLISIGALLITAGFCFWVFLLPLYFINLKEYLVSGSGKDSGFIIVFYLFWNHIVVQLLYINMLKHIFKNSTKWRFFPGKHKEIAKILWLYAIFIIFVFALYSCIDNQHPAYGIFSNFNWNTKFKTIWGTEKFNLKIIIFAIVFMFIIFYSISMFLWWTSIKLNKITFSNKNKQNLSFLSSV